MFLVRYLDVVLVALTVPVLVLAGLPAVGALAGGAAWIASRLLAAFFEDKARRRGDLRQAVGINMAAMIVRAWLVALTVLTVGLVVASLVRLARRGWRRVFRVPQPS